MTNASTEPANGAKPRVPGYLPADVPPPGAMLSLGFQQVLTMFPAILIAPAALSLAWRRRAEPAVRFLILWLAPELALG